MPPLSSLTDVERPTRACDGCSFRQVDAAYAEADFSNVCCVSVDEMPMRKSHDDLSDWADLVGKRVLFAAEGKDQETWVRFVETLENHHFRMCPEYVQRCPKLG